MSGDDPAVAYQLGPVHAVPNEQAALKILYLVIKNPLKNRSNITGRVIGWKKALNTLAMYYGDRLTAE